MSKICLACDINDDNDNSLLADLNKNDIPLWSKKEGNYSLLPKLVGKKKFNPNKTEFKKPIIPKKTNVTVRIPVKTNKAKTWVLYWAATDINNYTDVNDSPVKAYDNESNSGLIKTDNKGEGFLILNCPQLYSEDNITYPRHVHYTTLTSDNVWDENVKALIVTCNLDFSAMKNIIENKTHIIINASKTQNIEYSFKLNYKNLEKLEVTERLKKITESIEKNTKKQKDLNRKIKTGEIDIKYIPIVVYCESERCELSKKLIKLLIKTGFVNIVKYSGGFEEWEDKKSKLDITDFEDSEILYYEGIRYIHHIDTNDITNNDYSLIGKLIEKNNKPTIDFNSSKYKEAHNYKVSKLSQPPIILEYDSEPIDDNINIEKLINNLDEDTNTDSDTDEEEIQEVNINKTKIDDEDNNIEEEEPQQEEDLQQTDNTDDDNTNNNTDDDNDDDTDDDNDTDNDDDDDTDADDDKQEKSKQKGGINKLNKIKDKIKDSLNIKNNKYITTKDFNTQYRGWGLFQYV